MTDQQRHDWLGYSSGGHFETPAIDALARRGVCFEQAYSSSTTCIPSRSSLLTGVHHHRLPEEALRALPPGSWTVARELQAAGYETACIGRMHLHPMHADQGFETMRICENTSPGSGYEAGEIDDYGSWMAAEGRPDWRLVHPRPDGSTGPFLPGIPHTFPDDLEHHPTAWIEREATSFLGERDPARPLLLIVSFPHPHGPYDPPEPYASMYSTDQARLPDDGFAVNEVLTGRFRDALGDPRTKRCATDADRALLAAVLTNIRALVRQIDDAVGRIVDALDWDSTLLFVTSDHGDYGGHRGLFSKVPWLPFDDLLRVPLVVSGGAVACPPRRSSSLVQSASFAATALDYAGVEIPDDTLDFPSLRPLLDGDDDSMPPQAVGGVVSQGYPTVRSGDLKLVLCWGTDDRLLFDLADDPGETVSLADDPGHRGDIEELTGLARTMVTRPRLDVVADGRPLATW